MVAAQSLRILGKVSLFQMHVKASYDTEDTIAPFHNLKLEWEHDGPIMGLMKTFGSTKIILSVLNKNSSKKYLLL